MISFRPIETRDLSEERLLKLAEMRQLYVDRSEDESLSNDKLFLALMAFLKNPETPWTIWFLWDDEEPIGYAVTEMLKGTEGPEMNITQAFIGEGYRGNGVQEFTVQKFAQYAKDRGCAFLTSLTRRGNPEAYIRWMGRVGFQKRLVMVEKDLREA